ncbi:MAG: hypothetical protein QHH19_05175 [Candidatus Thermoplasmatota archaeon]|jgi:hypothetical protein|nr:hypothetical protein [Candidatus Thermoplasmatota archaeon]
MVCYAVPTVAAIVHYATRKKVVSWRTNTHHLWLNLLLLGGAIFGVVDHLWNGELFLIGENIFFDLLLGVTITVAMFVVWAVIVTLDKKTSKLPSKTA